MSDPIGIVYVTTMSRPDAALTLSAMHTLASRNALRIGAVCVAGAGLGAAVFCDVVDHVYAGTRGVADSNWRLPIGFAATVPLAPDPPMVGPVISAVATYPRGITGPTDTALPHAVLRNGIGFHASSAVILSGPVAPLLRALELPGVRDLVASRVKRLVIVGPRAARPEPDLLRQLIAAWPTPIFVVDRASVQFPVEALRSLSATHPVAVAYRAAGKMPYDAPAFDLLALHVAIRPDADWLAVSRPGRLTISSGAVVVGSGNAHEISITHPQAAIAAIVSSIA